MTASDVWLCPEHKQTDCSPLLNGCSYFVDGAERLMKAAFSGRPIEVEVEEARAEWTQLCESAVDGPADSPNAHIALLEAQVAYLRHALASLIATVDGVTAKFQQDTPAEERAAYNAQDMELYSYVYAIDTATHHQKPTYAWFSEGRPEDAQ